ncbi:ribonuclease P protein component [Candidatus Pacebacteria bacterium]|nr:ribonuclease P protein component [Candidatus Paceibacterota bacterium]
MLAKKERLTKKEFDRFFSSGKRYHSPVLQLIYTPLDVFHGAAVVGKKVHKKAVDRNKTRRRLYGALYALKLQDNLMGVYIVIAKPKAKDATYATLKQELSELVGSTKNLSKILNTKNK